MKLDYGTVNGSGRIVATEGEIVPPTGDSISVVIALMAISGAALVVLKKKEN